MNVPGFQGPAQWFIGAEYVLLAADLVHGDGTHSSCQWTKIFIAGKIQAGVAHSLGFRRPLLNSRTQNTISANIPNNTNSAAGKASPRKYKANAASRNKNVTRWSFISSF